MRLSLAPSTVLALALSLSAAPAGAVEVQLLSSVPANRASGTASGASHAIALSADGRWVAFTSNAPNLLPGVVDENVDNDAFLHDRVTGETILVSHNVDDENRTAARASAAFSISADGRYLTFASLASDLVPGQVDPGGWDFFFYDRVTGATELITKKPGTRTEAVNQSVGGPVVSADGRWVVFANYSRNLVADPGAGFENLYLWERRTGKVRLITKSTRPQASPTSLLSSDPSISADGRYVAFLSRVPDLVPGQGETGTSTVNVFLFDRNTGRTAVVDHIAASATVPGDGIGSSVDRPRITADGRFVVYSSRARNLVAGQSASGPGSTSNVFLYERATAKNVLVSRAISSPTATAAGFSATGIPSADGSFILFTSTAPNLVAGQVEAPGPPAAVFLYTRSTGKLTLVSGAEGSATTPANASSFAVAISGNGDTVLFGSTATDVVPGVVDENLSNDLFVWDRRTGEAELASHGVASEATAAAGAVLFGSIGPLLSNDGKWIAFNSTATDLVPRVRDTNALRDVVLQGRTGGRTLLTRRDPARPSSTPNGESRVDGLSADGRFVVFTSTATDLLPGTRDRNNASDVFLVDRTTGAITLVSRSAGAPGIPASGKASNPRISADGRFVVYESTAVDVVPGQEDSADSTDIFLWDRTTGATVLVSHSAASPLASGLGLNPGISADGSIVVFESGSLDLVPGQVDENFSRDVFV
jgi:Tol biopolymer transport system component